MKIYTNLITGYFGKKEKKRREKPFELFNQQQLVFCKTKQIFKLWNHIHPRLIFSNKIILELTKFFLVTFLIKTINSQILQPITYLRKSISLWNTCCSNSIAFTWCDWSSCTQRSKLPSSPHLQWMPYSLANPTFIAACTD